MYSLKRNYYQIKAVLQECGAAFSAFFDKKDFDIRNSFEKGRCIYRFEKLCVDDPELKLGDDTTTIVINPFGENNGQMWKGFNAFMEYMKSGKPTDSYTESLAKEVEAVKHDEQWRGEYKMMMEMISDARREEAKETTKKNAELLFKNGASYDLVRKSFSEEVISDEELREIYDSVMCFV